jgi:hypothetical protein
VPSAGVSRATEAAREDAAPSRERRETRFGLREPGGAVIGAGCFGVRSVDLCGVFAGVWWMACVLAGRECRARSRS